MTTRRCITTFTLLLTFMISMAASFTSSGLSSSNRRATSRMSTPKSYTFEVSVNLPPSGSDRRVSMGIDSVLSVPSELVMVRYRVPFGLNVEPRKGLAVVTQGGPGGEQPGDILRYTSQWTLGLPSGESIGNTVASFAGGISWQCSMFNVVTAKAWELVVEALTSNTSARTDEVVLIFERPMNGVAPPELM